MCVKLILPPRVRRSWLLMTTRLSASSLAGTARTLVAVGTASEAFMFFTTADAAPRSWVAVPSVLACAAAGRAACDVVPAAGLAAVPFAAGRGASGSARRSAGRCAWSSARLCWRAGVAIGVSGEGAAVVSAAVCGADSEVGEASPGR